MSCPLTLKQACPPPPPSVGCTSGMLPSAKHKAAEQQNQNKKLISDIVIGAFRCDKRNPPWHTSMGAHSDDTE